MGPAPAGTEHGRHGHGHGHVAVAARVSKSPSIPFLLLAAVVGGPAHAATELPAASVSIGLLAGSPVVLEGRDQTHPQGFGFHQVV